MEDVGEKRGGGVEKALINTKMVKCKKGPKREKKTPR